MPMYFLIGLIVTVIAFFPLRKRMENDDFFYDDEVFGLFLTTIMAIFCGLAWIVVAPIWFISLIIKFAKAHSPSENSEK